jgi:hypothetical protein
MDDTSDSRIIVEAISPYQITAVNQNWCSMLGYKSAQAINQPFSLFKGFETESKQYNHIIKCFANGEAGCVRITSYASNGSKLRLFIKVYPLYANNAYVTHFLVVFDHAFDFPSIIDSEAANTEANMLRLSSGLVGAGYTIPLQEHMNTSDGKYSSLTPSDISKETSSQRAGVNQPHRPHFSNPQIHTPQPVGLPSAFHNLELKSATATATGTSTDTPISQPQNVVALPNNNNSNSNNGSNIYGNGTNTSYTPSSSSHRNTDSPSVGLGAGALNMNQRQHPQHHHHHLSPNITSLAVNSSATMAMVPSSSYSFQYNNNNNSNNNSSSSGFQHSQQQQQQQLPSFDNYLKTRSLKKTNAGGVRNLNSSSNNNCVGGNIYNNNGVGNEYTEAGGVEGLGGSYASSNYSSSADHNGNSNSHSSSVTSDFIDSSRGENNQLINSSNSNNNNNNNHNNHITNNNGMCHVHMTSSVNTSVNGYGGSTNTSNSITNTNSEVSNRCRERMPGLDHMTSDVESGATTGSSSRNYNSNININSHSHSASTLNDDSSKMIPRGLPRTTLNTLSLADPNAFSINNNNVNNNTNNCDNNDHKSASSVADDKESSNDSVTNLQHTTNLLLGSSGESNNELSEMLLQTMQQANPMTQPSFYDNYLFTSTTTIATTTATAVSNSHSNNTNNNNFINDCNNELQQQQQQLQHGLNKMKNSSHRDHQHQNSTNHQHQHHHNTRKQPVADQLHLLNYSNSANNNSYTHSPSTLPPHNNPNYTSNNNICIDGTTLRISSSSMKSPKYNTYQDAMLTVNNGSSVTSHSTHTISNNPNLPPVTTSKSLYIDDTTTNNNDLANFDWTDFLEEDMYYSSSGITLGGVVSAAGAVGGSANMNIMGPTTSW